ncbi:autophagy protein Apg5-domain-containing protein [Scheffersomyces coipomensis]|uniref:autophagy protein Apg5-domain-containing protein n=1 Tax=Scheffersomyces coipomensis TaxID=1788519 RepID=UPI00315DE6F7
MELHGEDHGLFYEVREKLWNGSINITIRLHVDDTVKEFLLSIHRNSYFALYFESIVSYFKLFIPSIYNKPVWLEYDGQPIKWNVPVGVLYDYLYLPSVIIARANDTTTTQIKNSWVLELKYDKYPSGEIIPFIYQNDDLSINYKRMLNEVIVNQLKQSCYVLNSSSKPIMGLSESDSNHLWYGIETHNWMTFNAINSKIIPTFDAFRIPIRIYVSGEVTVIQNPISPTKGLEYFQAFR